MNVTSTTPSERYTNLLPDSVLWMRDADLVRLVWGSGNVLKWQFLAVALGGWLPLFQLLRSDGDLYDELVLDYLARMSDLQRC